MRLRRASDSTISLPASDGIWPPTRPVLPPCGTIGVRVSLASFRIAATSATLPGRSTSGVRPVELVARLDEVGRESLRVADGMGRADDGGERSRRVLGGGVHGGRECSASAGGRTGPVEAGGALQRRRRPGKAEGYMPSLTTCQTLPTPSPVVSPGFLSLTQ